MLRRYEIHFKLNWCGGDTLKTKAGLKWNNFDKIKWSVLQIKLNRVELQSEAKQS